MPEILNAETLIPIGSILVFLSAVWYLSSKVSDIVELQRAHAETKKVAESAAKQTDFERHLSEYSANNAMMVREITDVKLVQARDGERWINVEKILQTIQEDLKKVLNR